MPSVIDAVSAFNRLLNTVVETQSVIKKIKTISETRAKEIYSYLTEIIDLLDDLVDYKVVPEILIKFWSDTLNDYRKNVFEYFTKDVGITVKVEEYTDELLPYPVLREQMLQFLNDISEYLTNVINYINQQIESGKVDIYADTSIISLEIKDVKEFMDFYKEAQEWLREHENDLYQYTQLTLHDVIDDVNTLRELIYSMRVYVKSMVKFAKKFELYDLMDDVNLVESIVETIADAPNIAELAIGEDESDFAEYEEAFMESIEFIDDFVSRFENLLDEMYKRILQKIK